MDNTNPKETNQRILAAAKKVFSSKGYAGARMQEIADEAGINKGLISYYSWTKEKLFDSIFSEAMDTFMQHLNHTIKSDFHLLKKLDLIVDQYIDLLIQNPHLPQFILAEIHSQPDKFLARLKNRGSFPDVNRLMVEMQMATQTGQIRRVDPFQLLLHVLSLCVFPFASRPLITGIVGIDNTTFFLLMEQRKTAVKAFLHQALDVNQTDKTS